MDEQEQAQMPLNKKAYRDKTWDECGIEEKVERLRREFLNIRYALQRATETTEALRGHSHDALGQVVVRLERGGYAEGRGFDPLA